MEPSGILPDPFFVIKMKRGGIGLYDLLDLF